MPTRILQVLGSLKIGGAESRMMELQSLSARVADTVVMAELDLIAAGGKPVYGGNTSSSALSAGNGAVQSYAFVRHSLGRLEGIEVERPAEEEDPLLFSIGDTGVIVNEFPSGIVFQIQLAVVSNKMNIKQLRGLRPVFATRQSSGKYLYTAGAFRRYSEAAAALPLVKGAGFSSAYIVAFKNGKSIAVSKARAETE